MTRSATPPRDVSGRADMTTVGYIIAGGVLLLLFPLLPFIALAWLLSRWLGTEPRAEKA
ncbi:DUF7535 family protein [Natranaeroarchaeum sulfidigenes]|uniref:Uncharacterized protein n=1 Tax=Natranaeroarchaeum sulfidigenes TaxID=2784880 RepID=A0A897MNQ6_9EURY|nr:hypothetical protein [Natranaeroarchaeum sulfidigenes]QSG01991.1 hypothetical protein AArcS_0767 [Natranaeroarchaeum sulfidigenes]